MNKKKRIVSALLCLMLVLTLLPITALADKAVLKDVTISGVTSPVAGVEIPSFTCSGSTATSSDGTTITVSSKQGPVKVGCVFWGSGGTTSSTSTYRWTMPEYGNSDLAGETFQTGQSYFLWVLLGAYENDNVMFELSKPLNSINTANSTDKLPERKLQVSQSAFYGYPNLTHPQPTEFDHGWSDNAHYTYTWVKLYYPCYTYVSDGFDAKYPSAWCAEVNASWPDTSKTAGECTVTSDEPARYAVQNVKWYPEGKPSNVLKSSDKFLSGLKYTVEFDLKTVDAYTEFRSGLSVDGFPGDVTMSSVYSSSAHCKYTYDALYEHITSVSLTGIQSPVAGQPKQTSGVGVVGNQCKVSKVEVSGNFDASGNYKAGETYTMKVYLQPNSGYDFPSFNSSMVTVNTGTVSFASLDEFWDPYVQITLKAGGEKEKVDLGNLTVDLTNGPYIVSDLPSDQYTALFLSMLMVAAYDKTIVSSSDSKGYELNSSGKTDIEQESSGGVVTWKAGSFSEQAGNVTITLSTEAVSHISAGSSYYSSITFKFPGGVAQNLGTLTVDLTGGTYTVDGGESNGKAVEETVKAASQISYKLGDPSGLDLDKDGNSDVLLSWNGGSLQMDVASSATVGGEFTLNLDKTATMALTDAGQDYYSKIVFKLPGSEPLDTRPNPFVDVFESDLYYNAVLWAFYAEPQITNGRDLANGIFAPDATVKRGECVTFLWRAMGCPEPSSTYNPFTDVSADAYYYKPVLWAVENNITNGTTATTFAPEDTLTTLHILTFLYRALGVGSDGWHDGQAAAWAATDGNENIPFHVAINVDNTTPCPRWCVVQFLYVNLK